MMDPLSEARSTPRPPPSLAAVPADAPRARRVARIQFGLCLAVTVAVLVYLLSPLGGPRPGAGAEPAAPGEAAVGLTPSGAIRLQPDSPLARKLQVASVKTEKLAAPVLTVTGTVVASLRPAKGRPRQWQFSSAELLTTYTDWQKAVADIAFATRQLDSIRKLGENRVAAGGVVVGRLTKLVEAGTESEKDLATARTELLQAQIQGRKDVHEAETALRLAQRTEAALSRQLQLAGVDPDLLRITDKDLDVVVGDVPEAAVSRVKLGQGCEARFSCLGGKRFAGTVRSVSPALSKERRALRVLFTIDDPDDLLRPGMFADVGLGTDAREALLVPSAGVVHVGRTDYLLVRVGERDWRPTAVQVGEVHGDAVEILDGVRSGTEVIGQGAILLKPTIVETVQGAGARGTSG
jgi:hypothetical protein